jgi:hypothetical protein
VGIGTASPDTKLHVDGAVKITGRNILEFGGGVAGKQADAGKIGYGTFDNGASLNIVGAGTSGADRKITFWNEGGATFTGNVGIGTSTPAAKLHLYGGGSELMFGSGGVSKASSIQVLDDGSFGGGLLFNVHATTGSDNWPTGMSTALTIRPNGNVGIGTTSPGVMLDVADHRPLSNSATYGYLNVGGAGKDWTATLGDVSIRAIGRMVALGFNATSDARLKTVIGLSDHAADLALLRRLRITDYTMRDRVQFGDQNFKKIIAQELEEVFPQAVHQHTGFLPDLFARPTQVQRQGEALLIALPAGLPEAAAAGQRLKLIGPAGEVLATLAEAVEAGSQQLLVTGADSMADTPEEVFVFGLEHTDVRTVDYEAVAMLNVSATQALARQVEELHQQNAVLHAQCLAQGTQANELRAAMHLLQRQVADLLSQPARVAQPA